ncbi:MAG: RusA family crossover junction endodeoxyribonuclease [Methylococcaceae bacterium]
MSNNLPIPSELKVESPNLLILKKQLLDLYEEQTGKTLNNLTNNDNEMSDIVVWLNKNSNTLFPYYYRRRSVAISIFSPDLSSKVLSIAQFHCPICQTESNKTPIHIIPIRISPVSKQAISKQKGMRVAFERAIRDYFKDKTTPFSSDKSICLLIVFVVKQKGIQKDLDNMAKAMIDSIKTILFGDDRQIDHLNIIKIKSPDEEYVYLNIRETILNTHHDVLVPRMLHSWAGQKIIDINNFL